MTKEESVSQVPERPDLEAIERRLAEAKKEHQAHPNWPCTEFGCDDVVALLAYVRSLEASGTTPTATDGTAANDGTAPDEKKKKRKK